MESIKTLEEKHKKYITRIKTVEEQNKIMKDEIKIMNETIKTSIPRIDTLENISKKQEKKQKEQIKLEEENKKNEVTELTRITQIQNELENNWKSTQLSYNDKWNAFQQNVNTSIETLQATIQQTQTNISSTTAISEVEMKLENELKLQQGNLQLYTKCLYIKIFIIFFFFFLFY
jgi:hypothetical protein